MYESEINVCTRVCDLHPTHQEISTTTRLSDSFLLLHCSSFMQGYDGARAVVDEEVVGEGLVEVGADVSAETAAAVVGEAAVEVGTEVAVGAALDAAVPGMAVVSVCVIGRRIVSGNRRRGDRRRFVFAAIRAALGFGVG